MTAMDNSARSINRSSSEEFISFNTNENVNSISNAHNEASVHDDNRGEKTEHGTIDTEYAIFSC